MAKRAANQEPEAEVEIGVDDLDAKLKALEEAERAIDDAYTTGKAERSKITQAAQLDAAEAVAMAGIAMEADVEADEAMRISVIAEKSGDRAKAKEARAKERAARKAANRDHKAATRSARKAYNAIKFSAPNRMGFMRFVQVLFAVHIIVVLVGLIMTSRDTVSYNSTSIVSWIMIILEGVAFWFFINRYKIARPFVLVASAIGILLPTIYGLATNTFDPFTVLGLMLYYAFLFLYFLLSKRVKATMVNDLSKHKGVIEKDEFSITRKGWPFIRNLIMYFIIFSVLGHWMEAGLCQFIIMGWVQGEYDPSNTMLWRDWLYPFPMHGAAVVIIAVVLYPLLQLLKRKIKIPGVPYVISFALNGITCGLIEFCVGLFVNADHQLWDYSNNFCNIMGQVCLQNVLAFAAAASIITWFVYPLIERGISRVPNDVMNIAFIVVLVFGGILWSLYIIDPPDEHKEAATPEAQQQVLAENEAEALSSQVILMEGMFGYTQAMIDGSKTLDKEKLKADLDAVREAYKVLAEDAKAAKDKAAASAATGQGQDAAAAGVETSSAEASSAETSASAEAA